MKTKDPGVGISYFSIVAGSWISKSPLLEEEKCEGVQCFPEFNQTFTYNSELANGEDNAEVITQNSMGAFGPVAKRKLKVDNVSPYAIKLVGLATSGAEISATPHQLTVEATDGTSPTPSSGIKSIKVAVDGAEIGQPAGSCSPGECTASGQWTINGENLGAGVHQLGVTATDNAGNQAKKEYTFAIRNATPVALGPGSVDPATGQFALSATDVSIAGVGGVSRVYASRQLTAGAEGPLGPQWSTSLGTSESLSISPNGSAVLTAPVAD